MATMIKSLLYAASGDSAELLFNARFAGWLRKSFPFRLHTNRIIFYDNSFEAWVSWQTFWRIYKSSFICFHCANFFVVFFFVYVSVWISRNIYIPNAFCEIKTISKQRRYTYKVMMPFNIMQNEKCKTFCSILEVMDFHTRSVCFLLKKYANRSYCAKFIVVFVLCARLKLGV